MDAIAVTDHGCVQAFPDANHAVDKGDNFKILYGVEGYLVDDMKELAENEKGQTLDHTCVVFDIETTGFSPIKNQHHRDRRGDGDGMERLWTNSAHLSTRKCQSPMTLSS
ncbi:MAG: hypothetical protein ACLTR6_11205 [Clostridium fessum]